MVLNNQDLASLYNRVGKEYILRRCKLQDKFKSSRCRSGFFNLQWRILPTIFRLFLRLFFLKKIAIRNTIEYRVEKVDVFLRNLPQAFYGFSILHLSDIHIESIVDKCERLRQMISEVDFDLCVITGDFRSGGAKSVDVTVNKVRELVGMIQCRFGIVAVLGNYDIIEMVTPLEELGVKILLNESLPIKLGSDVIWIAGVDDPHFFRMHNINSALHGICSDRTKILLSHSPEIIKDASDLDVDYYLSGHTHGGQICLPNGLPVITNCQCKKKYSSGAWRYRNMAGYTSRGVGFSRVQARFFCPPEITIHRLMSGKLLNQVKSK